MKGRYGGVVLRRLHGRALEQPKLNANGSGDPNLTFRNMLHAFRGENLE